MVMVMVVAVARAEVTAVGVVVVVSFHFANCFVVFSPHHQSLNPKGIVEFSRHSWNKIHMIFINLQLQLLYEAT